MNIFFSDLLLRQIFGFLLGELAFRIPLQIGRDEVFLGLQQIFRPLAEKEPVTLLNEMLVDRGQILALGGGGVRGAEKAKFPMSYILWK